NTGWVIRICYDKVGLDPFPLKLLQGLTPENVVADTGDERYAPSQSRSRYRLVRTLSTGIHEKRSSDHRLSGRRQLLGLHHHVGIGAANNVDGYTHRF